jgi:hypothetical protein
MPPTIAPTGGFFAALPNWLGLLESGANNASLEVELGTVFEAVGP